MSSRNRLWLHWFAILTAAATLALIWIGGLVTSHGAGMAVPDWPTTFGYNMFFFPVSKWVGGVFYEHSHRLLAAFVGGLTSILAGWIWASENRGKARWMGLAIIAGLVGMLGHRGSGQAAGGAENVPIHFRVLAVVMPVLVAAALVQLARSRGALRWLAMTAFFGVILQGVLGGLRVVQMKDAIGILHATLAQLFFATLCAIALFTSRWWRSPINFSIYAARRLRYVVALVTVLIFAQLILGASMRHQHAGLAIPDFPMAYGRLWPATDADSVARYNQKRQEVRALNPITGTQVSLQMAHRIMAFVIVFAAAWASGTVVRRAGWRTVPGRLGAAWLALLAVQVVLGASVIWTNKAADIATAHVVVGALSLVTGILLTLILSRALKPQSSVVPGATSLNPLTEPGLRGRPAGVGA